MSSSNMALIKLHIVGGSFPATESDAGRALRWLDELGVLVHPGDLFGFPGSGRYVISLLARPAAFAEGVARILAGS